MAKSKEIKYVTTKRIDATEAHYRLLIGERSNGKTYSPLLEAYKKYLKSRKTTHYERLGFIRRWDTDFIGETSSKTAYNSLMHNGEGVNVIKDLSDGEFIGVEFYNGKYYLTKLDGDKVKRTDEFIAYAFSINSWEHTKGASFPSITTVLFDEFITRGRYLVDEFVMFQNLLSTIIRLRDNVVIYMCGNTVNMYGCPYFKEMGITRIKEMNQGDLDVYTYGTSHLKVAIEFTDSPAKNKKSNVYFAFNNPKLDTITGQGAVWEMDLYPHCPCKILPKDVYFTFYISYEEELLQGDVVINDSFDFLFIHRKTTPLKELNSDLIYTPSYRAEPNFRRNILKKIDTVSTKVANYFIKEKVFYQDNDVGEAMRAYLNWCKRG